MNKTRRKYRNYQYIIPEHHEKCLGFFEEIENGGAIYVCLDGEIAERGMEFADESSSEFHEISTVCFSVLNDAMISYDAEMFRIEGAENLQTRYRPFFCAFNTPLDSEIFPHIQDMNGNWYEGRIISEESDYIPEDGTVILDGYLEISASPINIIKKRLIIFKDHSLKKEMLDSINNLYNPSIFSHAAVSDIQEALDNAWDGCIPETIDIYNVGHGNCDYIRNGSNGKRVLYDVGYNYPMVPKLHNSKYFRAVNAIRCMKPGIVIISHWDLDHFIGCAYAKKDLFNVKWIAPGLVNGKDKAGTNAMRVAHYLDKLGNLLLVDRNQKDRLIASVDCTKGIKMNVWLGRGTSQYITKRNIEGLMVELVDANRNFPHILLSGDVPYGCMPTAVLGTSVEFLHVPHHCSKMELTELKKMNSSGKGKCAIVSTNRKKDKAKSMNCDSSHKDEVRKKFEQFYYTIEHSSGDDEHNLSIRMDCYGKTSCFR